MPKSLTFMDCPHCGKRVRTDATHCHHCGQLPVIAVLRSQGSEPATSRESDSDDEHQAVRWGGHSESDDDFDYEEFLEEEFGKPKRLRARPWWWYVAWVVLTVFVLFVVLDAILLLVG